MTKSVSRIELMRPKSRFSSARAAWKDIDDKTGVKPSQVRSKHTAKAWMWVPKSGSGVSIKKNSSKKRKSTKSTSKKSHVKPRKGRRERGGSASDISKESRALLLAIKDPNVKEIRIIK